MGSTVKAIIQTEPFLTYLMPCYQVASWSIMVLRRNKGDWALPVSAFGCAWAVRNTVMARRRLRSSGPDAGMITMGAVLALSTWEQKWQGPFHGDRKLPVLMMLVAAVSSSKRACNFFIVAIFASIALLFGQCDAH